jgi:hypothetical protein
MNNPLEINLSDPHDDYLSAMLFERRPSGGIANWISIDRPPNEQSTLITIYADDEYKWTGRLDDFIDTLRRAERYLDEAEGRQSASGR